MKNKSIIFGCLSLFTLSLGMPGLIMANQVDYENQADSKSLSKYESRSDYRTAFEYIVRFLPRFQTWGAQMAAQNSGSVNTLIGPIGMGPEYKAVVAINDDTLYTSATMDLTDEPQILTLPTYQYKYSIIQLDGFGTVLDTGLVANAAGGIYALVGPNFTGTLPSGVTEIKVTSNWTQLAIRTDKYLNNGGVYTDVQTDAENFRTSVQLKSLSEWMKNPTGGATSLEPLSSFSTPTKTLVDLLAQTQTEGLLKTMQFITASPSTTPLSTNDNALIHDFNVRFNIAKRHKSLSKIIAGAKAGHAAIIKRWNTHIIGNNWVHFNNMGDWGTHYLDRAAGNEYIQYGNKRTAAYYAQAFLDGKSHFLTGAANKSYTITFTKDQIPTYTRFWSFTAYTGDAVELVPNSADKYVVASYTPGLVTNPDGSITIYLSEMPPSDTSLLPNWLPIPSNKFSVMLRVYGPTNAAEAGTYVPPVVIAN